MGRFDGKVALVSGAASGIGRGGGPSGWPPRAPPWSGADIEPTAPDGIACDVTDAGLLRGGRGPRGRHATAGSTSWPTWPGSACRAAIADVDPDEWRRIIDVNLTGTFLLSQAALPALLESTGCIVNMASVAGLRATPYNAAYCASKGGVIMLTKSMAIELAKAGVRVNAVCPASVDTPFLRNFSLPEGADLSLFARAASPMGGWSSRTRWRRRSPTSPPTTPAPSAAPPWSSTGPRRPDGCRGRCRAGDPARHRTISVLRSGPRHDSVDLALESDLVDRQAVELAADRRPLRNALPNVGSALVFRIGATRQASARVRHVRPCS